MNTERLVLALFDVVLDGDMFLCGRIRWALFVRSQSSPTTTASYACGTMLENTYFDPAAMADDLLRRRFSHAIVGWDASEGVKALGRESAGPVMGPFLYDPTAPEVVAIARHLRRHAEHPRRLEYPLVRVEPRSAPETKLGRLTLWVAGWLERRFERSEHTAEEEAAIVAYMQRHRLYSTLRPAGLAGKYDRHDIAALLSGRLFDPLKWMEDQAGRGIGRACEFDWIREGLAGPQGAPTQFTLEDGLAASPDKLAALWRVDPWRVVEAAAWKVNILNQLVHVGFHGFVTTNRLEGPAGDLWLNRRERAMWRYSIDTHSWWNELSTLGHRGASA